MATLFRRELTKNRAKADLENERVQLREKCRKLDADLAGVRQELAVAKANAAQAGSRAPDYPPRS